MWFIYFLLIIGLLILIDWGTYKLWPGNKNRSGEIYASDKLTAYAGIHHIGFRFEPDYDSGEYMQLIVSTLFHQFFYNIHSWKVPKGIDKWNDDLYRFGFYLFNDDPKKLFITINLLWRDKDKTIWMPWDYECHHVIYEGKDGKRYIEFMGDCRKRYNMAKKYNCNCIPVKDIYDIIHNKNFYWSEPYEYILKNGMDQRCIGMYHVEEREWRPRATFLLPIFKHTRKYLNINLTDEIGEGVDSWKGGVTGFSGEMLPGEDPHTAYQRIMKETKFN